ncbi:MAG: EVE domain-containing protein [Gammaproteobacteria bacterium]|nr:EVE domain-containing protein [Gammaproteobacteria bacterium]MBV8405319.1 EVE domain-containing protein [Gammaproteobacteria bacterium]
MHYWLMKTEPASFSVEDLAAAPRRTTRWDGVRNYQARNMLRDQMQRGDEAFLYYSSTDVPGIVAIMQIVKEGYPDVTAFDRKDHHYDPGSDPLNPRWFMVDVQLKRRLARTITLEELRAHARKELRGMLLLRPGNRLSVTPVEAAHWKFILSLE